MKLDKITRKDDEWYTPEEAIYPIIKYLKPGAKIWCPFDSDDSNFVRILRSKGFKVINSHIREGKDFFNQDVPEWTDYIISNPPYSLKSQVLSQLYWLGVPFMMLIGCVGIFESQNRFEMFKNNKVELLIFNKRVKFIKEDGTYTSPPFSSWYICSNVLDKQITFDYLGKEEND